MFDFITARRFDPDWQDVFRACQETAHTAAADDPASASGFGPPDAPMIVVANPELEDSDVDMASVSKVCCTESHPIQCQSVECATETICATDTMINPEPPLPPPFLGPMVIEDFAGQIACVSSDAVQMCEASGPSMPLSGAKIHIEEASGHIAFPDDTAIVACAETSCSVSSMMQPTDVQALISTHNGLGKAQNCKRAWCHEKAKLPVTIKRHSLVPHLIAVRTK